MYQIFIDAVQVGMDIGSQSPASKTLVNDGIFGAVVNGWLMSTILISSRLTSHTTIILLNLTVACLGRSLLGGFPFSGTSILAGSWLFGNGCCQVFAFLRQFFGVAQLATLALLSVERLIISRHPQLEKRLSLEVYVLGVACCWLAAVTWSSPPLTGVGRYGCDVTGLSCEIDWSRTSERSQVGFNAALLLIGNVLPAMIACTCTWLALVSSKSHVSEAGTGPDQSHQHSMNKTAAVLVVGMFVVWLPQAILASWLFLVPPPDNLIARRDHLPKALVALAPLSSEVSVVVPVFVYLACEPRLRRALLGVVGKTPKAKKMKRTRRGTRLAEVK